MGQVVWSDWNFLADYCRLILMKTKLFWLIIGLIFVGGLAAGGYFWWRPRVANQAIVEAADAFLSAQDNNDVVEYQNAMNLVDKAIRWGKYDSTVGLFRGQVLVGLGRYDEARDQYEKVSAADPSAQAAVDDLISQLPQ